VAAGGDEFALWGGQHPTAVAQQASLAGKGAAMAHATAGFQWMDIQFGKMHDIFLSNEASELIAFVWRPGGDR
jgi:hypothetical protein